MSPLSTWRRQWGRLAFSSIILFIFTSDTKIDDSTGRNTRRTPRRMLADFIFDYFLDYPITTWNRSEKKLQKFGSMKIHQLENQIKAASWCDNNWDLNLRTWNENETKRNKRKRDENKARASLSVKLCSERFRCTKVFVGDNTSRRQIRFETKAAMRKKSLKFHFSSIVESWM